MRENLRSFIEASKGATSDGSTRYSTAHPSGKTTLATSSQRNGANIRTTAGPSIERRAIGGDPEQPARRREVLFIDEIHRLGKVVEEILYPAMEDFALDLVIGQGPGARTVRLSLPRFTVIGATTRLALLSAPLRTRFGATYRLDFYEEAALEQIVENAARALNVPLEPAGRAEIARRGRGTPRVALRVLRRVRDYAQVRGDGASTARLPPRRWRCSKSTRAGWMTSTGAYCTPSSRSSTVGRWDWRPSPRPSARPLIQLWMSSSRTFYSSALSGERPADGWQHAWLRTLNIVRDDAPDQLDRPRWF